MVTPRGVTSKPGSPRLSSKHDTCSIKVKNIHRSVQDIECMQAQRFVHSGPSVFCRFGCSLQILFWRTEKKKQMVRHKTRRTTCIAQICCKMTAYMYSNIWIDNNLLKVQKSSNWTFQQSLSKKKEQLVYITGKLTNMFCFFLYMPKTFFSISIFHFSRVASMSSQQGFGNNSAVIFSWGCHFRNWVQDLSCSPHFYISSNLTWARLEANPFVNGSRYQHSVCTGLDREKYSTLHTCGTKILPCEEDGVIMVLGMVRVAALLRVGPSAHLLQAARWVATFDQAYGLQNEQDQEKNVSRL